jgi:hypothetical protein
MLSKRYATKPLPVVKRRIADPVLAAQVGGLHASLMLAQHANDLILGKSASPHRSSPSDELTYHGMDSGEHVSRGAAIKPGHIWAASISAKRSNSRQKAQAFGRQHHARIDEFIIKAVNLTTKPTILL